MAIPEPERLTPAEYLKRERAAETKSEYRDGEIIAMTGASRAHNLITTNIVYALAGQLRGKPCEVYSNDMRVRVAATNLYTYPDVVVVCGEPRFEDAHVDTLLNPTVLVEVLSPSTEDYDRGRKFLGYRSLESLQEYLLVAQNEPRIERFARQASGLWLLNEVTWLDGTIELTSIECALPLRAVYYRVLGTGTP